MRMSDLEVCCGIKHQLVGKQVRSLTLLVATALLLSACGSSKSKSTNPPGSATTNVANIPANTVSKIGTVAFVYFNGRAADGLGISNGVIDAEAYEKSYQALSAGDVLSIATPAGSWAEMLLNAEDYFSYRFQDDIRSLGDMPKDATLSFSGDGFPAFSNIPIPEVDRITQGAASNITADNILTADTNLTWSLPSSENALTLINLSNSRFDNDGNLLDAEDVDINCVVFDDGEFTFPKEVKELLSKYTFNTSELTLSRVDRSITVRGDATVFITNVATFLF